MTKVSNLEHELADLRLGITGSWSVEAFTDFLRGVNDTYERINAVDFFVRAIQYEDHENEVLEKKSNYSDIDFRLRHMFYGFPIHGHHEVEFEQPENFDSLIAVAARYTGSLHVVSISFASPGWVELIGSLNPLKVLADAIVEWRKQNVEKEKIRQEAETERLRIRSQFAMDILRWCESITANRRDGRDRLPDIEKKVLRPAEDFIARIAGDGRITEVQILPPHSREPEPAQPVALH